MLAYHANNVSDNSYAGNDHLALARDLTGLAECGWRIVSLDAVLDWHEGKADRPERCVALTFDDGSDFDFRDIDHPSCGVQRSFFNILNDFQQETGLDVHASAFVIASRDARKQLDVRSLAGRGWWNDDWWAEANESGLLSIECHGWDHLHPVLDRVAQREGKAGDFRAVDSFDDCDRQLRVAGEVIAAKAGGRAPRFFAFPWGQWSDYLVRDYLPKRRSEHGFRAAFTTRPEPVRCSQDRWRLPRLVCGSAWNDPEELLEILERLEGTQSETGQG